MPVAVGLGLLLLALVGCGQASPATSRSPVSVVTIVPAAPSVTSDDPLLFHVRAEPAPPADLTVGVTIASPACGLAQSSKSVPIAAGVPVTTLEVPRTDIEAGEQGCEVVATITPGKGYAVGSDGSSRSATVVITLRQTPDIPPTVAGDPSSVDRLSRVTIRELVPYVTSGGVLRFEVRADPAPAAPLAVNLQWHDWERVLSEAPPRTVTVPTSGTVTISAATAVDAELGTDYTALELVTVTINPGAGYAIGSDGFARSATVAVQPPRTSGQPSAPRQPPTPQQPQTPRQPPTQEPGVPPEENGLPRVTIEALDYYVTAGNELRFAVTLDPPPAAEAAVNLRCSDWTRGALEAPPQGVKIPTSGTATFSVGTVADADLGANDILWVYCGVMPTAGVTTRPVWTTGSFIVDKSAYPHYVSLAASHSRLNEGDPFTITVIAKPPPRSPLTVRLGWSRGLPRLIQSPPQTVKVPTSGTTSFTVLTRNDLKENRGQFRSVTVHVIPDRHSYVATGTSILSVILEDDENFPAVTVGAGSTSVQEGDDISITLTADPLPNPPVTVNLQWDATEGALSETPPRTVKIDNTGTATVTLATVDDAIDNSSDAVVEVTIDDGDFYDVGSPLQVQITIDDDDD